MSALQVATYQKISGAIPPENPIRGEALRGKAIGLANTFGFNMPFSWQSFAAWGIDEDLLDDPTNQSSAPTIDRVTAFYNGVGIKSTPEWKAHVNERNALKQRLENASVHSDMQSGPGAFSIRIHQAGHSLTLVPVMEALVENQATNKVTNLVLDHRMKLARLIQSADWSVLPAHERIFAEELFGAIDDYAASIRDGGFRLNNRFIRLKSRLDSSMRSGELVPANGALKALVYGDDE